jgi:hypothetical protein
MDEKTKLILALLQIDNLSELLKENEYEHFMVSHLMPMKVEIERQLSNPNKTQTKQSISLFFR